MITGKARPGPQQRKAMRAAARQLVKRHGAKHKADIARGVHYCALVWSWKKEASGAFESFCAKHYHAPGVARRKLLLKLDELSHLASGSIGMVVKLARHGLDVADEPLKPTDELLGAFAPGTHLQEDYRTFNLAALAQLNFGTDDLTPPATRESWAARRLSSLGRTVIPADLQAEAAKRGTEVDSFVNGFNLHLDRIEYGDASIKFPKDTVRISHWGLRDFMTGLNGQPGALPKQRAIRDLMRRVVDGEVPGEIIGNSKTVWRQRDNTVLENGKVRKATPIGALRWGKFKLVYDAQRAIDPHTRFGNIIDNKFKLEREIAEENIVGMLTEVLKAPVAGRVARFVVRQLGRPIEAHDIYFKRFQTGVKKAPLGFDIRKRYPDAPALTTAIPGILEGLGFKKDRARWIGSKIRVDNSRSAGHAWGPSTMHDQQLLRVRVDKGGINEEEFSTYMHELGHCVEGVLTGYEMDYKCLWGVPNTAFTEGFAFTFQDQADFVLGRKPQHDPDVTVLQRFWEAFEIAGPALTEIRFFHWLYQHPKATAAEMHRAIRRIGDEVWTEFHARIFGAEGYGLMSVYSHMLWCSFYLADYPMGYIIAYQVRKYLRGKNLGREMQRMCSLGCIYPEQWMRAAVGQSISVNPLLDDTAAACERLGL